MKSTDRILATRYARAYDSLSSTAQAAQAACASLQQAAQALQYARNYMADPAVSSAQKIQFVQSLFAQQKQVADFLAVLLTEKRYYLLEACAAEVAKLTDGRLGIIRAQVQTAFDLSDAQKKQVADTLSRFSGKQARAQFEVRPELLGGLKVRMEDTLIDGSLQGKFEKLEEELIK